MAKPKITRLGDSANPYTKRKVTAAQQAASYKAAGSNAVRPGYSPPSAKPAKKRKASEPTGVLGRARKAVLDKRIKQSGG